MMLVKWVTILTSQSVPFFFFLLIYGNIKFPSFLLAKSEASAKKVKLILVFGLFVV